MREESERSGNNEQRSGMKGERREKRRGGMGRRVERKQDRMSRMARTRIFGYKKRARRAESVRRTRG